MNLLPNSREKVEDNNNSNEATSRNKNQVLTKEEIYQRIPTNNVHKFNLKHQEQLTANKRHSRATERLKLSQPSNSEKHDIFVKLLSLINVTLFLNVDY